MRLTRYMVTLMDDRSKSWLIMAGDMESAWKRFVADGYGGHAHDARSYDIRFHSFVMI
jgi:hypothetical protein